MSTRVISDRELLANLRFEVEELRRGLAAAIERLEALEAPAELDYDRHSRRVDYDADHSSRSIGRLHDYLALTGRPSSVGS